MPGARLLPLSLWAALWLVVLGLLCLRTAHLRRGEAMSPTPIFRFTAAVLLIAALVCSWFGVRKVQVERAATRVARELTGLDGASMRCRAVQNEYFDRVGVGGWVAANDHGEMGHKAWLSRDTCVALGNWIRSDKTSPTIAQITAVHVVAHEAGHIGGIAEESATECWAMRRDARAAMAFGASPDQADALARRYRAEVYPRIPDGYRATNCGGAE